MTLGRVGDGAPGTSSMCMIPGPPGTGKTTAIIIFIGALLHHSRHGNVGKTALNTNKFTDRTLRASAARSAFKILVVCSSNEGVDNVLKKLEDGIPDRIVGRIYPEAVWCARQGYNYRQLKPYSVNEKALPYNEQIHIGLKYATSKAKKAFGREFSIFFCTAACSGDSGFTELGQRCDIIFNDEAGQALEPE